MHKILLVEDDQVIRQQVGKMLSEWGFEVVLVEDFMEVLSLFVQSEPHLVLMDIGLPLFNGYHWCQEIRKISKVPIMFLSSRDQAMDIVMAINMGADDFIIKPFSPRELVLRVNNIFKRIYRGGESTQVQLGNLNMNHETYEAFIGDHLLNLTVKAFELLWILCKNPERVFSKTELYEKVWQEEFIDDTNTLNVHIHAVRQELTKHSSIHTPTIKTVWGLGYKIEKPRGIL